MISVHEARRLILEHVRPLSTLRLLLAESLGFCLAEEVRADRDMPPADRSAMDGYAVRHADLNELPSTLRLVGEVAAGSSSRPRVRPGTCVGVLTGANVPPGADAVVMVEHTSGADGRVVFNRSAEARANIRRQGEVARKGQVLLTKGRLLGAAEIGLCAAVGKVRVRVRKHARVAILCTGDELREVGARARAHEIRDSNGPALRATLKTWGHPEACDRIAPDDPELLATELRQAAASHDVVLLSAGVSVGKYDFVRQAVQRVGAKLHLHGVNMKPGKPLLYATLSRNRLVFGLPGNPVSALNAFHEFVLPALRRMAGFPDDACRPCLHLPLLCRIAAKPGRTEFLLARLSSRGDGTGVSTVKTLGSADLAGAALADGVVVVPESATRLKPGSLVEFHPWRPMP